MAKAERDVVLAEIDDMTAEVDAAVVMPSMERANALMWRGLRARLGKLRGMVSKLTNGAGGSGGAGGDPEA